MSNFNARSFRLSKRNKSRRGDPASGREPRKERFRAADVARLLSEGALEWRELVQQAQPASPREITQLRQLLRGMERNGELVRDPAGRYLAVDGAAAYEGEVVRRGKQLCVADWPLAPGGIRAGDHVRFRVEDGVAYVTDITQFSPRPLPGVLQWQGRYPHVEAVGELRGRVGLTHAPSGGEHGDTVNVTITGRDRRGLLGHITENLSDRSVLEQAVATAIGAFELPFEWPAAVVTQAHRLPRQVYANRFSKRLDLTELPLVTIDGASAKDFDDAVYAEALAQGGWRLVVAIADVAHYVKRGSPIDEEALQRGTSTYFPEQVVPMLPFELSNELCSLKPDVDRLALVCDMRVTPAGSVVSGEFSEAVMRSQGRLTYDEVYAFSHRQAPLPVADAHYAAVGESLRQLYAVYAAFSGARQRRGALEIETHEAALTLTHGRVSAIEPVRRNDAHQLIEEAMIAANVAAAEFLIKHDVGGLYRVHEPPEPLKLDELRGTFAAAGVRMGGGEFDLAAALSALPEGANRWVFMQLALRAMQQAYYTPDNRGHFGLALPAYAHFTSPIRRYPDLLVHRAIKAVLGSKQGRLPSDDEWHGLGEQCSQTERRAESAEWFVSGWLKCEYLRGFVDQEIMGTIAGVTDFGLFVELDGFFVQGLLHVSNLGGAYFSYDARGQALAAERGNQRYQLGDRLNVRVRQVEPSQGKVDLELASNSLAGRVRPGSRGDKASGDRSRRRG